MEERRYRGLVFYKEAPPAARSGEEKEIFKELEKSRGGDELEDDFIEMAGGVDESMKQGTEMAEDEDPELDVDEAFGHIEDGSEEKGGGAGRSSTLDDFSVLLEEINNRPENKRLMFLESALGKKSPKREKKRVDETTLDECNRILNRMGELHSQKYLEEREEMQPERRTRKKKTCGNWEEAPRSVASKPTYI
jgi:hypothetical protein